MRGDGEGRGSTPAGTHAIQRGVKATMRIAFIMFCESHAISLAVCRKKIISLPQMLLREINMAVNISAPLIQVVRERMQTMSIQKVMRLAYTMMGCRPCL